MDDGTDLPIGAMARITGRARPGTRVDQASGSAFLATASEAVAMAVAAMDK